MRSYEDPEPAREPALVSGHLVSVRHWRGPDPGSAAVVLVHGIVSGRYLLPTGRVLARRYRVLAPDLPGFGQSWRPARSRDIDEQADVVAEVIENAGVDEPTVVGHSVGSQVAVSLAVRHPGPRQ
jgi:pimeloyl-ACP methyl ester carboxylesterase